MSAMKGIMFPPGQEPEAKTTISEPRTMMKIGKSMLIASLLLATSFLPIAAQDRDRRDHHGNGNNQTFYNGVRSGGAGGQYSDPRYGNGQYSNDPRYSNGQYSTSRYNNGQYNNGQYNNGYTNTGGIGPGKGALIGGAGGAVLGAIFGRGLKGTLIGGAAGAGIGAVVGEVHQKNQQNQYYPR
jgi:hypothetical protein